MGACVSAVQPEEAARLKSQLQEGCTLAAQTIWEAEVMIFLNGAGFSADSGLAVYGDVAKVPAYAKRGLTYQDVCQPHWLYEEPELFWGFWGQCYNDYRMTDPHEGYEIIHHWVGKLFRHTDTSKRLQKMCREADRTEDDISPYEVKGRAGSFFIHTSNVDAHHYDWFPACEIRECHGNTELYQCAGSRHGMGRMKAHDDRCKGIWRAPLEYRFHVDKDTMLAPQVAPDESFEVVTNHWAPSGNESDSLSAVPRVGRVKGNARRHTLRHMISGKKSDANGPDLGSPSAAAAARGFGSNHPVCPSCGGPARPAILMFGDYSWRDNDAQEERFNTWTESVKDLATERKSSPLRVVLLEVGAGGNVTTIRNASEFLLKDLLESGADATLLRVNPDFPLADKRELAPHVVSLMGRGLESLRMMNAFMGPAALVREMSSAPPPPDSPPPAPDSPVSPGSVGRAPPAGPPPPPPSAPPPPP